MKLVEVIVIVAFSISRSSGRDATFRNLTLDGSDMFIHGFTERIDQSDNLKNSIPSNAQFFKLTIHDASIPILYENSVTDMSGLLELELTNDGIENIHPGAFRNLTSLRRIKLRENKIQKIEEDVFNAIDILYLDLSHNEISTIEPHALSNMPVLKRINLSYNKISYWDNKWFANDPYLQLIFLNHNSIENLGEQAFKSLIDHRHSVETLDLGNNMINTLAPEVFDGMPKIGKLSLVNNKLTSIDLRILDVVDVDTLYLNDNTIACLTGDTSEVQGTRFSWLRLEGNTWNCSCLEEYEEWIISVGLSDIKC